MNEKRERLVWVDALRVLACFGVIALHIWAPFIGLYGRVPTSLWWLCNIVTALIAWCVPVFVLISGAILLGQPRNDNARLFLARRMPVVWLTIFWTVFFVLFSIFVEHELVPGRILDVLIQGSPYYHLWFLYMIVGLYLCTPILCRYVVRLPPRGRRLTAVLVCLGTCLFMYFKEMYLPRVQLNIVTMCLPFIGYYLIGYELRITSPGRGMVLTFLTIFVLSTAVLVVVSFFVACGRIHGVPHGWLFGSFSPIVGIMAVSLFQLLHAMAGATRGNVVTPGRDAAVIDLLAKLSPLTLGIYVVHPLFIRFLSHVGFPGSFVGTQLGLLLNTVAVFAWSALTVWALSRIPCMRWLVMGGR